MRPGRECPYADADALRVAIVEAGSIRKLAANLAVDRDVVRRWQREFLRGPVEKAEREPRGVREERLSRRIRELEREGQAAREIREAIERAARDVVIPRPVVLVKTRPEGPRWSTPVDVVFHVSDMQYGEVVHDEDVPGGRYSPEVFRDERLPRFVEAAKAILQAVADQHPLGTVWFAQGGDYCEGDNVFKGQAWHLALDAGAQVATLAPVWASALATVAQTAKALQAERVAAVNVIGNHGTHGGRSAGAVPPSLSYDFLAYEMTRHILAGMPDGGGFDYYDEHARKAVYFEAAGWTFLLSHGDQDRGGGIIGVAGVSGVRNDMAVRIATGVNHRYHLVGHYHRAATLPVGGDSDKRWNGDWCGANNLSVGRGGGSEPMQRAYVVHPTYGVSQEWPVRLAPGSARAGAVEVIGRAA